jgi:hypothetical protein
MNEELPSFRYHPDPISSGVIVPRAAVCLCCEKARGYIYVGPANGLEDLSERICPWCIKDGGASMKFDATFADDHPLLQAKIHQEIIDEVIKRTPGYFSWQQDSWITHCKDACAFMGDASIDDLINATEQMKARYCDEYKCSRQQWSEVISGYQPGGSNAFYKFACLNCGEVLLGWDCD